MISHLSFADDLLVFFDGSSSSLNGIFQVLSEFRNTSGLYINGQKTVLFLNGNNSEDQDLMASQFGISKGNLPVKYLGLPLSHKLKKSDWIVLVDRIRNRLNSWMVRHLSFAGRLQLVKSVLNSIINYWLSAFILPHQCLKNLEHLCKSFLWKGNAGSAKGAKVSWNVVCSPKQNGGLGLRRLIEWNKVFGLKLLWRFISGSDSLWSEWIKNHLIGRKGFWANDLCLKGSWGWKRIMKLRQTAKGFLSSSIKSGKETSFWLEKWLPDGILIDLVGRMGPVISGIPITATVDQVIEHGEWSISNSRSPTLALLRSHLPLSPPTLNPDLRDEHRWKSSHTTTLTKFHSRKTWLLTQPILPLVTWHREIWFKECTPKHAFHEWIVAWRRLPTRDRLRAWGLSVAPECVMCSASMETLDHLMVSCRFAQELWNKLLTRTQGHGQSTTCQIFNWLLHSSAPRDNLIIEKMLIQTGLYHLWLERNARVHSKPPRQLHQIISAIHTHMRSKLLPYSYNSISTRSPKPLLQLWFEIYQPTTWNIQEHHSSTPTNM